MTIKKIMADHSHSLPFRFRGASKNSSRQVAANLTRCPYRGSERVMGQKSFFDFEHRLEAISAKGDPLETIKKIVPWEDFRADIEAATEAKPEQRKSNAGRGRSSRSG